MFFDCFFTFCYLSFGYLVDQIDEPQGKMQIPVVKLLKYKKFYHCASAFCLVARQFGRVNNLMINNKK